MAKKKVVRKKAVKKKPVTKKSVKKKSAKKKSPRQVSLGRSKDAEGQKELPGMEEPRVTSVDRCIGRIKKAENEIAEATSRLELERGKLQELFVKHKLIQYSYAGRAAELLDKPGETVLKIKKIKDK